MSGCETLNRFYQRQDLGRRVQPQKENLSKNVEQLFLGV